MSHQRAGNSVQPVAQQYRVEEQFYSPLFHSFETDRSLRNVGTYLTTRCRIPEDRNLDTNRQENLKTCSSAVCSTFKQDIQFTYNVKQRCVRVTSVAMEKQEVLDTLNERLQSQLSSMQSARAILYRLLQPARLYHILPHQCINDTIWGVGGCRTLNVL